MQREDTIAKVKASLRIRHTALDEELNDQIEACLNDLQLLGIPADEGDVTILNAIKLWCRAWNTEDVDRAVKYTEMYGQQKTFLMMSHGYGGRYDG